MEDKTSFFQGLLMDLGLRRSPLKEYQRKVSREESMPSPPISRQTPHASVGSSFMFAWSYNGEKNLGEMGPPKSYLLDYDTLRVRSWQLVLENDTAKTVLGKFVKWLVGSGLKLNSAPLSKTLETSGIRLSKDQFEDFNDVVESHFDVWSLSKMCHRAKRKTLGEIASTVYKNAIVGGDCLVIMRIENGCLNLEVIDGWRVKNPPGDYGTDYFAQAKTNGNTIRHGVEVTPSGEHVAFIVCGKDTQDRYTYQRIEAQNKVTGLTMAFLVFGQEYRVDNTRGIPILASNMETLAKMDRYKEATVATAEEIAKVAYTIEHDLNGSGENPFAAQLSQAFSDNASEDLPTDINGKELGNLVQATFNKQTVNLPQGAKVKPLTNTGPLNFKEFFETMVELLCASVDMPHNVAMSKYNDSYSASRAAIKDWENTLSVGRTGFVSSFYSYVYAAWLHTEWLKGTFEMPGYMEAFKRKNWVVLYSWRNATFTGTPVPHIDPSKEVEAERKKLGPLFDNMPLTTLQHAIERLGESDSDSVLSQASDELKDGAKNFQSPSPSIPSGE